MWAGSFGRKLFLGIQGVKTVVRYTLRRKLVWAGSFGRKLFLGIQGVKTVVRYTLRRKLL